MALAYHRFTGDDYYRMAEAGILTENDRVELLDGYIVPMTPIGPQHASRVDDLARVFHHALAESAIVRVQNPVMLSEYGEPEPDIAIVHRRPHRYRARHPGPADILLVIEVADRSVERDRSLKLPLYARAEIPEAWLIDLTTRRIEVYREPRAGAYAVSRLLGKDAILTPVSLPAVTIRGEDLLG